MTLCLLKCFRTEFDANTNIIFCELKEFKYY